MKVETCRYESVERPRLQPDLPVTIEKQMIQRQTAERVVSYQLRTTPINFRRHTAFVNNKKVRRERSLRVTLNFDLDLSKVNGDISSRC